MDDLIQIFRDCQAEANSQGSSKPKPPPGGNSSKFSTLYKQSGKLPATRTARAAQMNQARKSARLQLVNGKRNIGPMVTLGESAVSNSTTANSATTSASTAAAADLRKAQMEKWKEQKKLREAQAAASGKSAFKPAGKAKAPAAAAPPLPPVVPPVVVPPLAPRKGGINNKVPTVSNSAPATTHTLTQPSRPVTRSMVAHSAVGSYGSVPNFQFTSGISGKSGAANNNKSKVGTTAAAVPKRPGTAAAAGTIGIKKSPGTTAINVAKKTNKSPVKTETVPSIAMTTAAIAIGVQTESPQKIVLSAKGIQTDPEVPKKIIKPKGMQFDDVYEKYITEFVTACSKLRKNSLKYTEILEKYETTIGEDDCVNDENDQNANNQNRQNSVIAPVVVVPSIEVIEDIQSILGATKLLLGSKLPQFAGLLDSYLMKKLEPVETLACDLEGWWEVAMIQVNKVLGSYAKLDTKLKIKV